MLQHEHRRKPVGFAISAALVAAGIGALFFGWTPLAAALITVGAIAGLVSAMRPRRSRGVQVPTLEDVSTPSKTRLKPIVKLREEAMRLITNHTDNPVISAMALDTQTEVDAIVVRAVEILEARRQVQKLSSGVFRSRAAVLGLEEKLAEETDPTIRASTEAALTARREELRILEDLELTQKRLNANLDEAESTLAELRSQLIRAVAESGATSAAEELDPFSEMTRRLRRLSSTMEESIEIVSTKNWA
ncbi:MAG: hypothetical protein ACR2HJ_10060 [Fimbriimonadales bacterium]